MTEPTYDIFISYSRDDIHRVNRLISDLKARLPELKYWYDIDGIESADEFVEKMVSAIDRSKFVLFVASDNSMESKWTKDEVSYALNTNKKVIPAIINDTILRGWFLFRLGRLDCINADIPTQFDKLVRDLASWCNYHISGPGLTSTAPRQMPASGGESKPYSRAAAISGKAAATAPSIGKKPYRIRLDKPGSMKLQVVKAVKDLFGHDLKTAKELVDCAPSIISGHTLLSDEDFHKYEVYFNHLGARISKVQSESPAPQSSFEYRGIRLDIVGVGPLKLATVKAIKECFGFGLKEAKDKVDSAPCILVNDKNSRFTQSDISRINKILKPFGSKISGLK